MKTSRSMKAVIVLFALVLATSCYFSTTLAKYAINVTASVNCSVAGWPSVTNQTNGSINVSLFKMNEVYDTVDLPDIVLETNLETQDSGGAAPGNAAGNAMLAPGTWGYVDVTLEHAPEAPTKCTVVLNPTYACTGAGANSALLGTQLKFYVKSIDTATVTDSGTTLEELAANAVTFDTKTFTAPVTTDTIRIYWVWEYGNRDPLGDGYKLSFPNYLYYVTADATLTLEQNLG